MKRLETDLKAFGLAAMLSLLIGGLLSWLTAMPVWVAVLMAATAILANGLIAHIEDKSSDVSPANKDQRGN